MTLQIVLAYAVLWATLVRTLLVRAHVLPASCARCGLHLERARLGQAICSCGS